MRTENVVPCHPGHNAVSSISGCPSCDHAALSFQSHVTLSTLLCYSPPTGKATPMHLVASDTFPSSATKQRNENKSECSLRSRREITDVLVPDCNMAAWSLLARRGRKIKKRFPPAFGGINLLVVGLFPCRDAAPQKTGQKNALLCQNGNIRVEERMIAHDESRLMIIDRELTCSCERVILFTSDYF